VPSPRLRRARIRSPAHTQNIRFLSVTRVCTMPDSIWTIAPSTRHSRQALRRATCGSACPPPPGFRLRPPLEDHEALVRETIKKRLFGKFYGSQPTTRVKDAVAKALRVAEADGPSLDQLDFVVRAFDESVGDPLVEGGEALLRPATDCRHKRQQGLVPWRLPLCDPCLQSPDRRPPMLALIERSELLLQPMQGSQLRPNLDRPRQRSATYGS
jgi:hypothetical protein